MKQFYGRRANDRIIRGAAGAEYLTRACLAASDQKHFPLPLNSLTAIFTEFLQLSRENSKNLLNIH